MSREPNSRRPQSPKANRNASSIWRTEPVVATVEMGVFQPSSSTVRPIVVPLASFDWPMK